MQQQRIDLGEDSNGSSPPPNEESVSFGSVQDELSAAQQTQPQQQQQLEVQPRQHSDDGDGDDDGDGSSASRPHTLFVKKQRDNGAFLWLPQTGSGTKRGRALRRNATQRLMRQLLQQQQQQQQQQQPGVWAPSGAAPADCGPQQQHAAGHHRVTFSGSSTEFTVDKRN